MDFYLLVYINGEGSNAILINYSFTTKTTGNCKKNA